MNTGIFFNKSNVFVYAVNAPCMIWLGLMKIFLRVSDSHIFLIFTNYCVVSAFKSVVVSTCFLTKKKKKKNC